MIELQGVSKQYGSKILLRETSARIGPRARMALVGRNGAGKSTLIRILLDQEGIDGGVVRRARGLSIGHLPQELPVEASTRESTVFEDVMRAAARRPELERLRADYEAEFERSPASAEGEALERYARVIEELEDLDVYRLEARAKEILAGMGFRDADHGRKLGTLSGGWRMRVALSRLLLQSPDLLLLDEPTNHLDLESVLWLEGFLRAFRGAYLIVSHDSEFLNRLSEEVLEIDQGRLWQTRGDLDAWRAQKEERLTLLTAQYESSQEKIAEIRDFVARFGAKATKARQAQSRLKQLAKLEAAAPRAEDLQGASTVRFRFPPPPPSGKEIVRAIDAGLEYPPSADSPGGAKRVFHGLRFTLVKGSRVAIVGVNGAGKTSLLRLLAGDLGATEGEIRHGAGVRVGYFAQHQAESLPLDRTISQVLEAEAPEMAISRVRAIAGAFLFSGDAVDKTCRVLSGGEKARVALARLLVSPSNFLILDEPTNHLDVESRGVLLDALQDYEGTLLLVSHDREFVSALADQVVEVSPGPQGSSASAPSGATAHWLAEDYETYVARKRAEIANRGGPAMTREGGTAAPPTSAATAPPPKAAVSNNQRQAWRRERDRLEAEVADLETDLSELGAKMSEPNLKPADSIALAAEAARVEGELSDAMEAWERVCSQLGEAGE